MLDKGLRQTPFRRLQYYSIIFSIYLSKYSFKSKVRTLHPDVSLAIPLFIFGLIWLLLFCKVLRLPLRGGLYPLHHTETLGPQPHRPLMPPTMPEPSVSKKQNHGSFAPSLSTGVWKSGKGVHGNKIR